MTTPVVEIHTAERRALVEWGVITDARDTVARRLVSWLGAEPSLDLIRGSIDGTATLPQLEAVTDSLGIPFEAVLDARNAWRPRLMDRPGDEILARVAKIGARVVVRGDAEWPARLDDLGDLAPLALYVLGDMGALAKGPSVTITGSRAATAYGEHVAATLASGAADLGASVLAGGSYGIDARAHRAAMAASGATFAVLAGGVDRLYPSGNTNLLEWIAGCGALISEYPPGAAPYRTRFLERARIMAALTDATVVVEAAARSGALGVARDAAALARPVGAVPGPVTSAASQGCHQLLKDGATIITDADDLGRLIGRE
jgi:DNA processing protein